MELKIVEIRDSATMIPALAIYLNPADPQEHFLIQHAGFSIPPDNCCFLLVHLNKSKVNYDPYEWNDRTMFEAHQYIIKNFRDLESGSVIDVEYILGETQVKKTSERFDPL